MQVEQLAHVYTTTTHITFKFDVHQCQRVDPNLEMLQYKRGHVKVTKTNFIPMQTITPAVFCILNTVATNTSFLQLYRIVGDFWNIRKGTTCSTWLHHVLSHAVTYTVCKHVPSRR